jgi:(1->4)-alpha-D-glucan 1-alpha-D-glucosylmutase
MHVPLATYRLQFNADFTFDDAGAMVSYLSDLGVSDVYASPIFAACKGSAHGYDVVDPLHINPELGGEEGFERLCAEVHRLGLFWLQDFVPNHMAYGSENTLLMDVLEKGEHSRFSEFFDIRAEHPHENLSGRLLAPFLGSFYGESLERGEIALKYDHQGLAIHYYEHRFPLTLHSYPTVFARNIESLEERIGKDRPEILKFLGAIHLFSSLSYESEENGWYDQTRHAKDMLWRLYRQDNLIQRYMDEAVDFFNGTPGDPESFDSLDALLSEQRFRLSFWKVATEEINYRRFFSINSLICLRVEDESVFAYVHRRLLELVRQGKVSGIRIDHVDGLYDPAAYLRRLRACAPDTYLVIEKILEQDEKTPQSWPVQGTTGYDFMNYVNGLFCWQKSRNDFVKLYYRFTQLHTPFARLVSEKKRLIVGKHMAGDIDNLAHLVMHIANRYRYGRDLTLYGLKRALVEYLAHFPVYRTYIDSDRLSESDRAYIDQALVNSVRESPGLEYELRLIHDFLTFAVEKEFTDNEKKQMRNFVMRLQQYSGPLMAKGFEDTVLYIYNKLISLNEVGGNPNGFGVSLPDFHAFASWRCNHEPLAMNATATHDMKRGEDVRARINVLSEQPREWQNALKVWQRINKSAKTIRPGIHEYMPDANDEYFIYQTLIGSFPFASHSDDTYIGRIKEYVIKAVREAKVHTAWIKPDTEYEQACAEFVESILTPGRDNRFLSEFVPFQRQIAFHGMLNSLGQTLIKIAAPGIPDFYQGSELWDLSLVDPDNRRPVDYEERGKMLASMRQLSHEQLPGFIERLLQRPENGAIKMFLIHRALEARGRDKDIFDSGTYEPAEMKGEYAGNCIAFMRHKGDGWVLCAAPRLTTKLVAEGRYPLGPSVWRDTCIALPQDAPRTWSNVLCGERLTARGDALEAGSVFARFPVALLVGWHD